MASKVDVVYGVFRVSSAPVSLTIICNNPRDMEFETGLVRIDEIGVSTCGALRDSMVRFSQVLQCRDRCDILYSLSAFCSPQPYSYRLLSQLHVVVGQRYSDSP